MKWFLGCSNKVSGIPLVVENCLCGCMGLWMLPGMYTSYLVREANLECQ